MSTISRTHRLALTSVFCVAVLALVPAALAGKPGGGGASGGGGHNKPGSGGTGTGTFSLVLLDSTVPEWNHTITFNVSSTAPYPSVRVQCYQNGVEVYQKTNGFSSSWIWGTNYGLNGPAWTGGAANCTAVLFSANVDGSNPQTEATMSFNAAA